MTKVLNKYDASELMNIDLNSHVELHDLIDKSVKAFRGFKLSTLKERKRLLEKMIHSIKNHEEELIIVGDFTKNNQYQLPKIHFKKSFQLGEYSIENDIYFKNQ